MSEQKQQNWFKSTGFEAFYALGIVFFIIGITTNTVFLAIGIVFIALAASNSLAKMRESKEDKN